MDKVFVLCNAQYHSALNNESLQSIICLVCSGVCVGRGGGCLLHKIAAVLLLPMFENTVAAILFSKQ
jgi:hypothetical protein